MDDSKRIQTKIWTDIGCWMPGKVRIELRMYHEPWSLDFYACTGAPSAQDAIKALRMILDGKGGPAKVKNEHGIPIPNSDALTFPSPQSSAFDTTFVPRRGRVFPFRMGDRVRVVSQVGSYTYSTRKLLRTIEALVKTAQEQERGRL